MSKDDSVGAPTLLTGYAPATTVDDATYQELADFASRWREDRGPSNPELGTAATIVINHEARLLDDRRYRDWLDRFTSDGVYWVPLEPESDPRKRISLMLDDRRRLEDRVALLETGWAHSQLPESRTCRQVTNVEAWSGDGDDVLVRCSVVTWEYRKNGVTSFAGRNDYVLAALGESWRIRRKIVYLVNSAGDVPRFSFIL